MNNINQNYKHSTKCKIKSLMIHIRRAIEKPASNFRNMYGVNYKIYLGRGNDKGIFSKSFEDRMNKVLLRIIHDAGLFIGFQFPRVKNSRAGPHKVSFIASHNN